MIHPKVLQGFGLQSEDYKIERYGSGLINHTFRLRHLNGKAGRQNDVTGQARLTASFGQGKDFIIQRINTQVFRDPYAITENHRKAVNYLAECCPDYYFLAPVSTVKGEDLLEWNSEYWRVLPFVAHTVSINEAANPKQAFEASRQFGRLARNLSGIDLSSMRPTIPNFHNLTLRYSQFQGAINNSDRERKEDAEELIEEFQRFTQIPITYEELKTDPDFRDRLMHHDTKINNVLLDDKTYEGVCVIDLDTLMPGKIISDLGDMVRTYVSPVSEEETDFSKIVIRESYYDALMKGYLSEVGKDLTSTEKEVLFYAGQFMIYMQGIRFLSDYLNGDIYYPIKYPRHNFNRAKNQLVLLKKLNEKESGLRKIIRKYLK